MEAAKDRCIAASGIQALIFDADVLIVLGQHPGNLDAITAISEAVDGGTFELLVPEVVQNAFQREKDTAAKRFWSGLRSHVKGLQEIRDVLPDIDKLDGLNERLQNEIEKKLAAGPRQSRPSNPCCTRERPYRLPMR